jgi:uncharacterized protein (TIGR02265 family)
MPAAAMTLADELQGRLAACGNGTARGVIISAVLDCVESKGGEETRERVMRHLSSKSYVDFFAYPVADLVLASYHGAVELQGGRETIREIGGNLAGPFFQNTSAGRLASGLLGGDMRRYCAGLPAAYGMLCNYGKRTLAFPKDGSCLLTVVEDPLFPELHAGAIESAGQLLGRAANTRVTYESSGFVHCVFNIQW